MQKNNDFCTLFFYWIKVQYFKDFQAKKTPFHKVTFFISLNFHGIEKSYCIPRSLIGWGVCWMKWYGFNPQVVLDLIMFWSKKLISQKLLMRTQTNVIWIGIHNYIISCALMKLTFKNFFRSSGAFEYE